MKNLIRRTCYCAYDGEGQHVTHSPTCQYAVAFGRHTGGSTTASVDVRDLRDMRTHRGILTPPVRGTRGGR